MKNKNKKIESVLSSVLMGLERRCTRSCNHGPAHRRLESKWTAHNLLDVNILFEHDGRISLLWVWREDTCYTFTSLLSSREFM